MQSKDWLKITAVICFVMVAVALLIARGSPAKGYELDIYAATPAAIWILLIAAIIGGIIIIIHQVITQEYENSKFWMVGFLVVITARVALIYVPFIRGYYSWLGDNITHIGIIKDILSTGHFANDLYYPVTHTLVSQAIMVTGMDDIVLANLSTALFSVIYVLSIYMLSTVVLPNRGQQLLVTLLTAGVMIEEGYNIFITAMGWSILLLPLFFYFLFMRRRSPVYTVLLLIFLILFPFFHPLSSLMVIAALVVIELSRILLNLILRWRGTESPEYTLRSSLVALGIEAVIFTPWVLSFRDFELNIRSLWRQLTTMGGPDVLGGITETIGKVNIQGFDVIILFIKLYGTTTLFLVLSFIGLYFLFKRIYARDLSQETPALFGLSLVFLSFGILYFLYLLGAPGFTSIGGQRLISYTMVFTPVFAGFGLFCIAEKIKIRRLTIPAVSLFVVVASILSILFLFHSPYRMRPNVQMTMMDKTGVAWFWEEKDRDLDTVTPVGSPERLAHELYGTKEAEKRLDIRKKISLTPDHFDYDQYSTVGESYEIDKYLVMTEYSRIVYLTVWEEVGRYNEDDFVKFERDSTVDRLYTNGEFAVYYIDSDSG